MKTSQTYPNPYRKALTRFAAVGLMILMSHTAQARTEYVFDNENMLPSQFPAADGYTINVADRVGKVEVTQYGLDYQVSGGALINGGTRALRVIGSQALPMNNWLTYVADGPITTSGPLYVAFNMEAETLGISTDPHELFVRIDASWSTYVAMKLFAGIIELPGGATAPISAAAGQTYRVVLRIDVDGSGNMTALNAWLDPAQGDEGSPTVSTALAGTTNISTIDRFDMRSQKAVTIIDELKFADSWDAVVPPLPADPGDLIVTLPNDSDGGTPGYQVLGGTIFVEVGGFDYVADTPLAPGTEVTFRMIPDTANDYVLTGWRGYKGPRDSNQPFQDYSDATILGAPLSVEEVLVIPIYASLNIRPVFELFLGGDIRLALNIDTLGSRYRIRKNGSSNALRTIWGAGEQLNIRAIPPGAGAYAFTEWKGDLTALNPTSSDTTPLLTAGVGLLAGPVVAVEARCDFTVLDSMTLGTTDVIGPNIDNPLILNGIEYEANNLGGGNSVPLCVMQAVVAEKAPLGLAGVADFETLVGDSGTLFYDPSAGADTPIPAASVLARDGGGAFDSANSVLNNARKLVLQIGAGSITVETGEFWYTEDGLATEDGPAAPASIYDNNFYYNGGLYGPFKLTGNPSGRVPTSGDMAISNTTSYDWAFNAADKVVMAGAVYMSRDNFQHSNPDDNITLWAKATYDDGTTSATLWSNKLEQSAGGADHFFGFEAPAGKYITSLHIWCRGRSGRAFTNADDLAVVLEDSLDSYTVTAASNNNAYGTVSGGGSATDGTTVTLTATPVSAPFLGWAYACAPCAIISTDTSIDVNVHGSVSIKGIFDPHPAGFGQSVAPVGGNLEVSWYGYPEFNYTVEKSEDLINWDPAGTVSGAGAAEVFGEPFNPPSPLFLRLDYCSK
jgi:hypothetical protein